MYIDLKLEFREPARCPCLGYYLKLDPQPKGFQSRNKFVMQRREKSEKTAQTEAIWPEWLESEILAEKFTSKYAFEDAETIQLPNLVFKNIDTWKRIAETDDSIAQQTATSVIVSAAPILDELMSTTASRVPLSESPSDLSGLKLVEECSVGEDEILGTSKFMNHNKHLLGSELYSSLITVIHYLFDLKRGGCEDAMPWELIYPKGTQPHNHRERLLKCLQSFRKIHNQAVLAWSLAQDHGYFFSI